MKQPQPNSATAPHPYPSPAPTAQGGPSLGQSTTGSAQDRILPTSVPQPMPIPKPVPGPISQAAPIKAMQPRQTMQPSQAIRPRQTMQPSQAMQPRHAMQPGQTMPPQMPQMQQGAQPMPQQQTQHLQQHQQQYPSQMMPNQGGGAGQMAQMPVSAVEPETMREGGEKALPRIAIHAFCERTQTAATIQSTNDDWRMSRANLKVYMGGLPAAIEFYRNESTPSLIIFESALRGPELFEQLSQLASNCDADTKVVMVGAVNDIKLYRELMEQGLSEYLVPPFHPLTFIRSISDLYADPDKPFVGRVIAFLGAKGGVGSSTLAHNVAWGLATKMGQETALVDMDSNWGTTGLDFNYDSSQGLEEALADPERMDETLLDRIMIRHTEKLSILPAAATLGSTEAIPAASYETLVNGIRGLSPLTVLDMPHIWSEWSSTILKGADEIVITATPDLANLRNAKNLIEFLKTTRPNDKPPLLVINKTGVPKTAEIPIKDFAAAVGIKPALVLGYEPVVYTEASNDGKMLSELKSAEAAFSGIMHLAYRLKTGEFPPQTGSKKGRLMPRKNTGEASEKPGKLGGLLAKFKKRK